MSTLWVTWLPEMPALGSLVLELKNTRQKRDTLTPVVILLCKKSPPKKANEVPFRLSLSPNKLSPRAKIIEPPNHAPEG